MGECSTFDVIAGVLINSFIALLGFIAIYYSIETDREIKRYEYIEDYNFNFITNKELMEVERKLESCYQKYSSLDAEGKWDSEKEKLFQQFCDSVFKTNGYLFTDEQNVSNSRFEDNIITNDYQKLINYLVYLESFVPLILNDQISFKEVDDLFGYRYFIAMNNPVMQENELKKESKYYQGCFKIYDLWREYRKNDIPMEHYALETNKELLSPRC